MAQNIQKSTTHSLREGNVVIASRPNTNKWQMRIKKPTGEWEFRSSETADMISTHTRNKEMQTMGDATTIECQRLSILNKYLKSVCCAFR